MNLSCMLGVLTSKQPALDRLRAVRLFAAQSTERLSVRQFLLSLRECLDCYRVVDIFILLSSRVDDLDWPFVVEAISLLECDSDRYEIIESFLRTHVHLEIALADLLELLQKFNSDHDREATLKLFPRALRFGDAEKKRLLAIFSRDENRAHAAFFLQVREEPRHPWFSETHHPLEEVVGRQSPVHDIAWQQRAVVMIDNKSPEFDMSCLSGIDQKADIAQASECVACTENQKRVALVPCGHQCLCIACAKQLPKPYICPICRAAVVSALVVFN